MERFDVAIVATLRPELLDQTIKSFADNLWREWVPYARFFINIDKAGCEDQNEAAYKVYQVKQTVIDLLGEENVLFNVKEPYFPTAWLWGIQQTSSRLVFHLEEDWIINYRHDFTKMVEIFDDFPNLVHLRLNQFVSTERTTKLWGKYYAFWNNHFFDIEERGIAPVGWCGHPSLNRGNWLRGAAKDIVPNRNPEKQFHYYPEFVKKHVTGKQFGIFQPPKSGRAITDIGREWMRQNKYVKTGGANVEWFTNWKKDERS